MQGCEEVEAGVDIRQSTEHTEQQCGPCDVFRLPLTEYHNGECEEAEACHTDLEFPLADARGDVNKTAEAAESTGEQNA